MFFLFVCLISTLVNNFLDSKFSSHLWLYTLGCVRPRLKPLFKDRMNQNGGSFKHDDNDDDDDDDDEEEEEEEEGKERF